MKYQQKPVIVEAMEFTEDKQAEMVEFLGGEKWRNIYFSMGGGQLRIVTLKDIRWATFGDFIVKMPMPDGGYRPYPPELFKQLFEEIH